MKKETSGKNPKKKEKAKANKSQKVLPLVCKPFGLQTRVKKFYLWFALAKAKGLKIGSPS